MTLNIKIPQIDKELVPRIAVVGVGGAGGNAVNNMIQSGLEGVEFLAANTDVQALHASKVPVKIQLGAALTSGLGAGSNAQVGKASAEEAAEDILSRIDGAHMLFITAGMGGGTGTGAAPVIARLARERNILTVAVVTKPFAFEGLRRMRIAQAGLEELKPHADTLIVIANENLFRVTTEQTPFVEAFTMADSILHGGVRGVTDLIVKPGLVNLDFADIRSVMAQMGQARIGSGEGEGEGRALVAAEAAIANPLLEETSMRGASGILINITGGEDMSLSEVQQAVNRVKEEVDPEAHIIFGSVIDPTLNGRMRVAMVATGINAERRFDDSSISVNRTIAAVEDIFDEPEPVERQGWRSRFTLRKLFGRSKRDADRYDADREEHTKSEKSPHDRVSDGDIPSSLVRSELVRPRPMAEPRGNGAVSSPSYGTTASSAANGSNIPFDDALKNGTLKSGTFTSDFTTSSAIKKDEKVSTEALFSDTGTAKGSAKGTAKGPDRGFDEARKSLTPAQRIAAIKKKAHAESDEDDEALETSNPETSKLNGTTSNGSGLFAAAGGSSGSMLADATMQQKEDDMLEIPAFLRRQSDG